MVRLSIVALVLMVAAYSLPASEDDVLIIEQDYNIIESGKDGPQAKDVRQILFINKEIVCIDEYGGKENTRTPTESILVDLKNKRVINLNHEEKKMVTESFDDRRKRLEKRKKQAQEDYDAQPEGPQREKMEKLFRALLDDKRKFKLEKDAEEKKDVSGVMCQGFKIVAADASYLPAHIYLHPELELPYENAEVLFLLQVIGEKLADFLKDHKSEFRKVPMELHLELAAGGHLDTKVVTVTKTEKSKLTSSQRGDLGQPFDIPQGYEERVQHAEKKAEDHAPERPD